MQIDQKTLKHLQTLSKVTIDDTEQFSEKLNSVVSYIETIGTIKNIPTDREADHCIQPLDTVTPAGDKQLLDNVTHEKLNNSIVVKSVLK